jgi:predicted RNA-binding protein with PUA domain
MTVVSKKNPSYLVKHRKKWQVKLTIPADVRWAFDNKTTFKRSTGCNLHDTKRAIIVRDSIVAKFKATIKLHRTGMEGCLEKGNLFSESFNNRPYPRDYQNNLKLDNAKKKVIKSQVEGWIKERLLNKTRNTEVLRYDFWNQDKKI